MVSSRAGRKQVALAIEQGHLQRRGCELMRISRMVLGYGPTGSVRDAPVIDAIRRLAKQFPPGVRLPANQNLSQARGLRDALGACTSVVEDGRPATAAETAQAAHCELETTHCAANRTEHGVEYDFVFEACATGQ